MADERFEPFIAVDIGSFSLKFLHVQREESGIPTLKALAHLPIPPFTHLLTPEEREKMSREDVEKDAQSKLQKFLTKHLTELLYDNQIQSKRAITLASGRTVTIRYFEIAPPAEKDGLEGAVRAEAAKQMPFSMENAVFGFVNLGQIKREEKDLLQIMVAALQKDMVALTTDNLKGGGLSNEGILTLPHAIELLIGPKLKPPEGQDARVAVIHCGHKTTSIMIYKNGVLNFYRDINMAGETITEAILAGGEEDGQKIEIKSFEEATELKHKIGVLPPDEIKSLSGSEKFAAQMIFNSVEKIFQHIQLSISFYISQFGEPGIDRAFLTGGSAAMKNFKEFIQESLEVSTEAVDPFSILSGATLPEDRRAEEAPAISPAAGLALFAGQSRFINFIDIMFPNRRGKASVDYGGVSSKLGSGLGGKFKFNLELDEQKLRILAGLIGVLVLLVILTPGLKVKRDIANAKASYAKLQNQLSELTQVNSEVTELITSRDLLSKQNGFAEEIKKLKYPNSEMLLELASATPKQIFLISADFTRDGETRNFKFLGHTDTSDRTFDFIKTLNLSRFFKQPNLESTEEQAIDEKNFFIKFAINGKIELPASAPAAPAEGQDQGGGG